MPSITKTKTKSFVRSPSQEPEELSVTEQAKTTLIETFVEVMMPLDSMSEYEQMFEMMIHRLEPFFKSEDEVDADETITTLTDEILASEKKIAKLEAALKKAKAKAKATATTATTDKPKAKSRSKTKSGGERAANNYSSFMALLKYMEQAPEVSGFELVADPQFAATAIKSKERYEEHLDAIMHDGQTLHGQTVTLKQAYDAITAAGSKEQCVDPMFKNAAVRTAILWAMIPAEDRPRLVDLGRAAELCR